MVSNVSHTYLSSLISASTVSGVPPPTLSSPSSSATGGAIIPPIPAPPPGVAAAPPRAAAAKAAIAAEGAAGGTGTPPRGASGEDCRSSAMALALFGDSPVGACVLRIVQCFKKFT